MVAAACGRVDFEPLDAAIERVIAIDPGPHHMGNDAGGGVPDAPEGAALSWSLMIDPRCPTATVRMDFNPPWGPNPGQPPIVRMNDVPLAAIIPFFEPCSADCDDFPNGTVRVELAASVELGTNTLRIDSLPDDDYFLGNVELHCGE